MQENVKVMKFGGTSVDSPMEISDIVDQESLDAQPVLVVSAFSGETDKLLKIAEEIIANPKNFEGQKFEVAFKPTIDRVLEKTKKELQVDGANEILSSIRGYFDAYTLKIYQSIWPLIQRKGKLSSKVKLYITDLIVGVGEVFAANVLAQVLNTRQRVGNLYVDINLADLLQRDHNTTAIAPNKKEELFENISNDIRAKIEKFLAEGRIPIVTGYIGYIPGGIVNVIDRGYTDSTAALTAVAVKKFRDNVKLQIWKEVPGLMSADPRKVEPGYNPKVNVRAADFKVARLRRKASLVEAAELADLGGMKAINPNGIWILDKKGIPLEVRNTYDPQDPGTLITEEDDLEIPGVRFISGRSGQIIYKVRSNKMIAQSGIAAKILAQCAKLGIPVDAISTSGTSVVFSIDGKKAKKNKLEAALNKIGKVTTRDKLAMICCIGNDLENRIGLLHELTGILKAEGINIETDGGDSENNINFIISEKDLDRAVVAFHKVFENPDSVATSRTPQREVFEVEKKLNQLVA